MVDIQSEEYILGQNIRKYRLEKGWSQKQLSDVIDGVQNFARYFSGE